ncbi:major facilitator superfamily transporter [Colletotrichum plurivorum]|uniref:Major facilitator superfamily transporter n=1 Tax=Colletotrichum plurivorum TaxID=2175906 RepID=A0A8H6K6A6_9PEZI|nr:major facilitator superfamily transporter [Colletotrichum plurivorum]
MAPQGNTSPRVLHTVRRSLSAAGAGSLRLLTGETDLQHARSHDEHASPTRLSLRDRNNNSIRAASSSSRSSRSTSGRSSLEGFFARTLSLPSIQESQVLEGVEFRDPFADTESTIQLPNGDEREKQTTEPPYHVFTRRQKWFIIAIIGAAGLFSGLSSNIYFPSLDAISRDLHVSAEMVSLTITSYLIIQGISPLFWGSISDALGRRPIYIASFAVYIAANVGLSFSPNFAVLMVFRGLQAAGSASTVSIGNGVIQDISPPAERGEFISFYQASAILEVRNFSIAVGPVLGGLLANFLGFRSIFVFLLVLSALVTIVIVVFLPETMRSIAGNGSLRLGGVYKPLIHRVLREPDYLEDPEDRAPKKRVTLATFVEPLRLLIQKDILINLIFGGVVYTIWSMVTSSTTNLFKTLFGLNELQIGLAFLPNGMGTIVGSAIAGKLMTRDYLATEAAYKASHDMEPTEKLTTKNLPADFPIERARLRRLPWIVLVFVVSTGAYGVSLGVRPATALPGWIAVPLLLQFFVAAASNAVFALNQTLVADLCPGKGASATAINNLVRCGLGAVGVAFIETFVADTGPGATFVGLAFVAVGVGPLAVVHWYWGQQWRAERMKRKADEDEKAAKNERSA